MYMVISIMYGHVDWIMETDLRQQALRSENSASRLYQNNLIQNFMG